MATSQEQIKHLEAAIANLEAQRDLLGEQVVGLALAPLRQQLAELRQEALPAAVPALEGERKLVTVMFADISGFTALSEKLDPEQVRSLMNDCFDHLVPVVQKYGGWVDKFIGDAILALFGAPIAYENHAERALHAALEMMEGLVLFNSERGTSLGLHLGINTGLVVAGGIGSQGQQQYSVMGDAVNLAARLEDASETGQILVGPNTYRIGAPQFTFATLAPIRVKGKSEAVPIYQLLGVSAAPGLPRGIVGLRAPLVGRSAELAQLREAAHALQAGEGGTIALIGEAGLGKSRLVAEARQTLAVNVTWAEGRALSYTEEMSYWITRNLLSTLIGVTTDTPLAEVGAALRSAIEQLIPDHARADEVYPYLARLLDAPLDSATAERVRHLNPEAWQGRMLLAFEEYIRAQAQVQPLILAWEDLHWADPSSLHLLETLLPLTAEIPLLLLLVFRTRREGRVWDFHERMIASYGARYQVITLAPLSRDESTQLVLSLLKIENLPDETRQLILNKAEGNPFFLEELLRSLLDAGIVVVQGGRAIITRSVTALEVPDTLQGVIAARIDRLPPESKRALQTASVIGRIFQQRVLAYLLDQEHASAHLDGSLSELRRRELINLRQTDALGESAPPDDLEYIFKHAVTQETVYNTLLIARRRALHRVAAAAIEAIFPDYLGELAATLAYHYERAEVADRAIHYLTRAADRAKATYANAEAIASYQRAIAQVEGLLGDPARADHWRSVAAQLLEGLGGVLELTAQHAEAILVYEKALAYVPQNAPIWQSRLHRSEGNVLEVQRFYEEALQAYGRAETALGPEPATRDPEWWQEWIMIQIDRVGLHYWRGAVQEMALLAESSRSAVEQYGTARQRSSFFSSLVLMGLRRDRYVVSEAILAHARLAVAAGRESGDLNAAAWAQFLLGFSHLWHADLDQAAEHLEATLALAERTGDLTLQSRCLTYLTVTCRRRGQVEDVRAGAERSLAVATAGQMIEYIAMANANLAWVALRAGDLAQAHQLGQAALSLFQQTVQGQMLPWIVIWPLIGTTLGRNEIAEAIAHVRSLLMATGQPQPEALALDLQAAIHAWDAGQAEESHRYLEQAAQRAQQIGYL